MCDASKPKEAHRPSFGKRNVMLPLVWVGEGKSMTGSLRSNKLRSKERRKAFCWRLLESLNGIRAILALGSHQIPTHPLPG